jgi:hypothetical protein
MIPLLSALLAFAVFLFWRSSGGHATWRGLALFYLVVAVLTLAFQLQIRFRECEALAACGLDVAKAFVWALAWPASWIAYSAGL